MDDEIEDIVGDVKYTDSQKSIATTNQYSLDFTDGSSSAVSDKYTYSSKKTYLIECDSEDSGRSTVIHDASSLVTLHDMSLPLNSPNCKPGDYIHNTTSSLHKILAQETYTQTSKTIIQLAENDCIKKMNDNKSLETQTSFVSIRKNNTLTYTIEVSNAHQNFSTREAYDNSSLTPKPAFYNIICNQYFSESQEEESLPLSISTTGDQSTNDSSNNDQTSNVMDNPTSDTVDDEDDIPEHYDTRYENTSEFQSDSDRDLEMESLVTVMNVEPQCRDMEHLHQPINQSDILGMPTAGEPDIRRFGALTPLTEESSNRKEGSIDVTPAETIVESMSPAKNNDELIFTNNSGLNVKLFKDNNDYKEPKEHLVLPPIQNQIQNKSCPNSPHLNSLFVNKSNKLIKAGTLPCLYEKGRRDSPQDRWEMGTKELASGESALICGRSAENDQRRPNSIQLPPIHAEGHPNSAQPRKPSNNYNNYKANKLAVQMHNDQDSINVKDKIKELKLSTTHKSTTYTKYSAASRSNSPGSTSSPDDSKLADIADRGCEALCLEALRKLRSSDWVEVMETLDDLPQAMQRYWNVVTENRIADIIRQVNLQIESPRPQVARSACATIAQVMKHTNFTKKPDFYETMTILLIKTGSYSRPLRRAANVALDDIVCGVELSLAVNALCVHGASHKSGLVRCATARLLVVCCALSSGGRDLLRSRPTSAAAARKNALRSMSFLLEDKSTDVRKYAERLYIMLRPIPSFESFYLTDVDTEIATRQMKKFDHLLSGPKEIR